MAAATPEIAVVARLKAATQTAAGSRVFPQVDTQEAVLPAIIVTRLGADGGARLSGKGRGLKEYTVRVDCYAATQAAAAALGREVRARLHPEDGPPWVSADDGVKGCFFADSTEEVTDDGYRVSQETYRVFHAAT